MFAPTLAAELRRTAQRHPDVPAVHFHGRDHTYAEWDAAADRFARGLLAAGVRRGDRIVLLLPAIPDYLLLLPRCGAHRGDHGRDQHALPAQEIGEILANADPRLVLTVGGSDGVDFPALIESARGGAPSLRRVRALRGRRDRELRGAVRGGRGRRPGRGRRRRSRPTIRSPSSTPAAPPDRQGRDLRLRAMTRSGLDPPASAAGAGEPIGGRACRCRTSASWCASTSAGVAATPGAARGLQRALVPRAAPAPATRRASAACRRCW